ncbi:Tetratricopeptide repeat-containing protein [Tenacibaculum sp. 190524A02b]|uniref:tetratricopeptide repeat protein n=1 Tax=Tenacibaculum vairaonense TaxID=3137860 RepID=UPI0032B15C32
MKRLLLNLLLLSTIIVSAQSVKNDSIINAFFKENLTGYFKVQHFFNKYRFDKTQIDLLLKKSTKNKNRLGQLYAYNMLGRYYRNNTNYEKALEYYTMALDLSRKEKALHAEIVTLNQIGVIYRRKDQIRSALNFHQFALELANKIDAPSKDIQISKSVSENSIGNIYLKLKQYKLALEKFHRAIVIQRELDDKRGLAINHQNIGFAYQNLGKLDSALTNYNKSLEYNLESDSKIGKVICHNSISNVLILQGNYQKAFKYINEVKQLSEQIGNKFYTSRVYNTLGYSQFKLGNLKEAKTYIKKSLNISLKHGIPTNTNKSYDYLSEIYKQKKDYKKAYEYYKKAIDGNHKTFNDRNIMYVNNLINKYDNEVKNNQIKNLAKENEITKLKLTRNRNILIIALVSIALFGVLLYAIYGQRLLNNDKKILMLEQEALQSQMNPHFVFNALNSIKLYIINNEQKNAVYYLNKFSKLIRSILESSKTKEVPLSDELKTMNLYMSIENIRFSNEIAYTESIDESINLEKVKVPPLILQPFLENAIWHGLSSKKGSKKVDLSVKKSTDEFIQIEIIDNGIGRAEAMKIKKSKSLKRKSIGIELTKQRLQNFTDGYKNNYSLIYIDLVDENRKPSGTKVSLKIPLV